MSIYRTGRALMSLVIFFGGIIVALVGSDLTGIQVLMVLSIPLLVVLLVWLLRRAKANRILQKEHATETRLKEKEDRARRDEESARQTKARKLYPPDMASLIVSKAVQMEMTPDMVRLAWGEPHQTKRQVTKTQSKLTWIWWGDDVSDDRKAFFEDDALVGWEEG